MPDAVTNLFIHHSAAQRYAAARPYFQPQVVARIAEFTGVPRFERALDVACGTGQSARALATIAERVEAIDISTAMLSAAEPHERVHYQVAPAEQLPFGTGDFDLVTISLAFHWVDQSAFLAEVARVLRPGGWLVIYVDGFYGEMAENADFKKWARETYPQRFNKPARHAYGVTAEQAEPFGFSLAGQEAFHHDETMTAEQLTGFLLTQSNVIAEVEAGKLPLAEAAEWILAGATPYFGGQARTMKFGGTIWFLQRAAG